MPEILHIAKITGVAGAEGHLLRLLPGLQRVGYDIRMLVLHPPGATVPAFSRPLREAGIPVDTIAVRRYSVVRPIWRIQRYMRQHRPDAVHTHMIHADAFGMMAAAIAGIPTIISSRHNDDRFRRWLPFRLMHRVYWQRVTTGIAISEAVRQFTIDVEYVPPTKIETIHYGREIGAPQGHDLRQSLGIAADAPVVGSVCRLTEQKGLTYALEAFATALEHIPDAHYIIAGDGPLRSQLVAQVDELRITEQVHFLGWQDDVASIFHTMDVLLAPSLWEGFGLVFLEAMAHAVPIVSTRTSAMPEIIVDGKTGFLVPPADADALVDPLVRLLIDANLTRQMGEAGCQRLETEFSIEKMVARTADLYHRLLSH